MSNYKSIIGEEYSAAAYAKAAKIIKSPTDIADVVSGTKHLKGIGDKITAFISEVVTTGSSRELDELRYDPRVLAVEELSKVIGVGPVTAKKWVLEGTLTIEAARNRKGLTKMQKIGLDMHGKVLSRVPRRIVEAVFDKVVSMNQFDTSMITGSYRRGADTSGDVDILVTGSTAARDLITPNGSIILNAGNMKQTYLTPVGDQYVQVDIFVSPVESFIPYLLYSTGSAAHNVRLRGLAKSKGLHLSQYALTDQSGTIIPLTREEDLYKILGIPYVPPTLRQN